MTKAVCDPRAACWVALTCVFHGSSFLRLYLKGYRLDNLDMFTDRGTIQLKEGYLDWPLIV